MRACTNLCRLGAVGQFIPAVTDAAAVGILTAFGLGATYNARISVRVIEGNGRVTAYGSIIDRITEDPTYVPAQ